MTEDELRILTDLTEGKIGKKYLRYIEGSFKEIIRFIDANAYDDINDD